MHGVIAKAGLMTGKIYNEPWLDEWMNRMVGKDRSCKTLNHIHYVEQSPEIQRCSNANKIIELSVLFLMFQAIKNDWNKLFRQNGHRRKIKTRHSDKGIRLQVVLQFIRGKWSDSSSQLLMAENYIAFFLLQRSLKPTYRGATIPRRIEPIPGNETKKQHSTPNIAYYISIPYILNIQLKCTRVSRLCTESK